MSRYISILFLLFTFSLAYGQLEKEFEQAIVTFDHRIKHPTDDDLGFSVDDVDLRSSDQRLDKFYAKVQEEKKAYVRSNIGKVHPDLIFEQFIYSHFTEEEIYHLKDEFPEESFYSSYGKQVKDIILYYEQKKEAVNKIFPQLSMSDEQEIFYSFPYLGRDRYILLHFWSSVCKSCIEKNRHFSELHDAYNRAGVAVISICVDYFPDNWKTVMEEEQFVNAHYYLPRTEFMNLSENFTLELSTTLLLNADLRIISRDIYKLDPLLESIIFD
ncbi:MAG: redoxin domain-containing protein [Saprospiraceae bacterium]|nr:redoxin domain-containing protein [Saprospiraceae bacterium]